MRKVIIAKDIKTILAKEDSFLKRAGFRISTASSNEQALALHKTQRANLIIANLDSADMSGEMLCSAIRDDEELRDVSIIIVGSDTEADLERCLKCRANAFVINPVDSISLLEEAHQLLHIAPRTACRISISVKFNGTSKKAPFIGFLENISSSGILFRAASNLHEGDVIKCAFSLPGSGRISAEAEIVRKISSSGKGNGAGRYGAAFTDIGSGALSAIEAFIKKSKCE